MCLVCSTHPKHDGCMTGGSQAHAPPRKRAGEELAAEDAVGRRPVARGHAHEHLPARQQLGYERVPWHRTLRPSAMSNPVRAYGSCDAPTRQHHNARALAALAEGSSFDTWDSKTQHLVCPAGHATTDGPSAQRHRLACQVNKWTVHRSGPLPAHQDSLCVCGRWNVFS